MADALKDNNEEEKFLDRTIASISEIAKEWDKTDNPDNIKLFLIKCLEHEEFNFKLPAEITGQPSDEKISIGERFWINSDFLRSLIYSLDDSIEARCKWYEWNKIKYEPFSYSDILTTISQLDPDFICDHYDRRLYHISNNLKDHIRKVIIPKGGKKVSDSYDFYIGSSRNEIRILTEQKNMRMVLADHIYLSKTIFLHWIRLKNSDNKRYYLDNIDTHSFNYNGFWGDALQFLPRVWNNKIDDKNGLMLKDAFKYYSDTHEWAEYEGLNKLTDNEGSVGITSVITNSMKGASFNESSKREILKGDLINRFFSFFNTENPKLKALGYIDKITPEEITYSQLKDIIESKQLDIDNSRGKLGKIAIESIRIKKVTPALRATNKENNLDKRERTSLIRMIAGLLALNYSKEQIELNQVKAREITDDLNSVGITIDDDTVRKYLKESTALLRKQKDE